MTTPPLASLVVAMVLMPCDDEDDGGAHDDGDDDDDKNYDGHLTNIVVERLWLGSGGTCCVGCGRVRVGWSCWAGGIWSVLDGSDRSGRARWVGCASNRFFDGGSPVGRVGSCQLLGSSLRVCSFGVWSFGV